jgi:hypothetical protein
MWCPQCQADVATEVSADGKRLLCTICGEEVRKAFAGSQHPETQSARELLDRWSKSDFLESYSAVAAETNDELTGATDFEDQTPSIVAPEPPLVAPAVIPMAEVSGDDQEDTGADLLPSPRVAETPPERPVRKIHRGARPQVHRPAAPREPLPPKAPVLNWRVDAAHQDSPPQHTPAVRPPRVHFEEHLQRAEQPIPYAAVERRDDQPHESMSAPHFDLETFSTSAAGRKPGRQESVFGQLLAYLGVGLLTVGTALVVWGYFGGAEVQRYQSTGWLISTAGQMLLFLGVVTLVSGGMQQTTHEVSQRVEYLGGRMLRIEQSTQEILKGPYFAKSGADQKVRNRDDDSQHA